MTKYDNPSLQVKMVGKREEQWRLETDNLGMLRKLMGEDLLIAFIRCFVHSDRLTSLAHFGTLHNKVNVGGVAQMRNFLTAFWFTVGTLRELAFALRRLRSALAKRGWLGSEFGPLDKLREVEDRWERNSFYRNIRNVQSFHVDEQLIERGLDILCERKEPVTIFAGDGPTDNLCSDSIGPLALLLGLDATEEQISQLHKDVYADTKIYLALDEVFVAVLKELGVSRLDLPYSERPNIWEF